jgi:hypothetical protein
MEVNPLRSKATLVLFAIILVLLQITSSSTSSKASDIDYFAATMTGVSLSAEEGELQILIYRDSTSAISSTSVNELIDTINATMGSVTFLNNPTGKTSALNDQLIDQNSQEPLFDAVILFGTSDNITTSGAKENLQKTLARGGGIIVAGSSESSEISENLNDLLTGYGIEMSALEATSANSLVPDPYILVRDFAPAHLPFMENVTQVIYHGSNLTLDTTQDETEDGVEILFSYPLCYSDEESLEATRKTLGTVTELTGGGRLVTLGSSFMFNDTFIRTADEESSQEIMLQGHTSSKNISHFDNWLLIKNLMEWISGLTGSMKFSAPDIGGYSMKTELGHSFHTITMGEQVWGTINLTSWENESLPQASVTVYIRILKTFLRSSVMLEVNPQQYTGSLSTKDIDLDRGWVTIGFEARTPGYGRVFYENDAISRMWIEQSPADPNLPSWGTWIVLAAGAIIFFFSAAGIWKLIQEIEKEETA